ncbi:MAG: hypothetical protein U9R75_07490 [Candidatus Thermoplasmatota archaeon]|nr:hypothetical protein [Candidatus Thermoplasmatota archaeon]
MGEEKALEQYVLSIVILLFVISTFPDLEVSALKNGKENIMSPLDPEVWVETESDTYPMYVEPGHAEELTISGSVHCDFAQGTPPGTKIYLELKILSNFIFGRTIDHVFIKGQEEEPLKFSSTIQDMTGSSSEVKYRITMIPNWDNPTANRQGIGETHIVYIEPRPYGSVMLVTPGPQKFNVGELHTIEIDIKNNGNCEADFSVSITTEEYLELTLPALKLIIGAGKIGTYPFQVEQGSGLGKEGHMDIKVRSSVPGDMDTSVQEIHFETYVSMKQIIFTPVPLMISSIVIILLVTLIVVLVRKVKKSRSDQKH